VLATFLISAAAQAGQGIDLSVGASSESGLHPGVMLSTARRRVVVDRPRVSLSLLAGQTTRLLHHQQRHTRLTASLDAGASLAFGALSVDLVGGFGVGRTFLAGTTWALTEDGSFEPVPLAGQWGLMPWLSVGFGGPIRDDTMRWFARTGLLIQSPYHDRWAPFMVSDVGVTFVIPGSP
jgi:hypothetical protein